MPKAKKKVRGKKGGWWRRQGGRRRARLISPTVAWSAIFGFIALCSLPVLIAVNEPATSHDIQVLTAETLCYRSCQSDRDHCLQLAGLYQPAVDRCYRTEEKCRRACAPELPETPEPPSLQSCVRQNCRPAMDACLQGAENDRERNACENRHLDCLTECRLQHQTGTPEPVSALPNPSVTAGYSQTERLAFGKAKQAVSKKLGGLDPTVATIERLKRQGLTVPESLAQAVATAQQAAQQAAAANSLAELQRIGAQTKIDAALAEANRLSATMHQLDLFSRVYDQADADLDRYAERLSEVKRMAEGQDADLDEPISDYDRLLDVARGALADSQKRVQAGDPETGLNSLETEVLDNLKEIAAIDQASRWVLNGTATLRGTKLVATAESQLAGSAAATPGQPGAPHFLAEMKAKLKQIDEAAAADRPNDSAVFVLSKELIDINELFRVALAESTGGTESPLSAYLNG